MFSGTISGSGRVFRNERQTADGNKFYTYSIGFGSKRRDGGYDNASMDVRFTKDGAPTAWNVNESSGVTYANIEIPEDGAFLTFRQYDQNGHKITRWLVQIIEWANK